MWPQEILNRVFEAATNRLRVSAQSPELETKVDILNNKVDTLGADIKAIKDTAGIKKITDPVGIDPTNNTVQLSGSKMELYGVAIEDRPDANTVAVGATFTIVDDTGNFDSYISNGTDWLEV